jgi:hypothetical protein
MFYVKDEEEERLEEEELKVSQTNENKQTENLPSKTANNNFVQVQEGNEETHWSYSGLLGSCVPTTLFLTGCCCLMWYFLLLSCFIFTISIFIHLQQYILISISSVFVLVFLVSLFFTLIIYIMYWFEICLCDYSRYLWNLKSATEVHNYVDKMKLNQPIITFSMRCYHEQGDHEHKFDVETFSEEMEFKFDKCIDRTEDLVYTQFDLIGIYFRYHWSFGDRYSINYFEKEKQKFIDKHKDKDEKYKFDVYTVLPGFRSNILMAQRKSSFISWGWYILASMMCLSVPYRLWMDSISVRSRMNLVKILMVNHEGTELEDLKIEQEEEDDEEKL